MRLHQRGIGVAAAMLLLGRFKLRLGKKRHAGPEAETPLASESATDRMPAAESSTESAAMPAGRAVWTHSLWKIPVAAAVFVLVYWLFGYFVALWRRQTGVRNGLDRLEERLAEPPRD